MNGKARAGLLLSVLAGVACNTGESATMPETSGAPEGFQFVSSALERDKSPSVSDVERTQFGEDSRDFAFALYRELADQQGNLFLSPYSLWVALGMLYAGSEGDTHTEMTAALHFSLPEPRLYEAFNATDLDLKQRPSEFAGEGTGPDASTGDLELRVVNAAFTQQGAAFEQPYLDVLAQQFGAGLFTADFTKAPEREREAINQWVADQTETRIQDLLPPGSISQAVALVLANAIYFKGSWLEPFQPQNTASEPFHAPSGDIPVPMMNGYADQYLEADGYQALELPYIAPALRMLFVLPGEGRFDEIEAALDRTLFDQIRTGLSHYSVKLKVPKFSFESSFELPTALKALGMQQAFVPGAADLSGIAGAPGDLFVDNVFHKTFIAVDEQGTEAAAATAIIVTASSAPPPAEFFLDRPFLFFIYDEPTGEILFLGRVLDPS
jgi:serpin B